MSVIFFVLIGFVIMTDILFFIYFLKPWFRALTAGHKIPLAALISMKFRNVPPALIVDCYIRSHCADLDISMEQLEKHYSAGGKPDRVVGAMIKAHSRGIAVPFDIVAGTDLAGYNVDDINPEEFRKAIVESDHETG